VIKFKPDVDNCVSFPMQIMHLISDQASELVLTTCNNQANNLVKFYSPNGLPLANALKCFASITQDKFCNSDSESYLSQLS